MLFIWIYIVKRLSPAYSGEFLHELVVTFWVAVVVGRSTHEIIEFNVPVHETNAVQVSDTVEHLQTDLCRCFKSEFLRVALCHKLLKVTPKQLCHDIKLTTLLIETTIQELEKACDTFLFVDLP